MQIPDFASLVDPDNFWNSPEDMAAHSLWPDWHGASSVSPVAVVRPANLAQAADVLAACDRDLLPVVIRGAGTEFCVQRPARPFVLLLTTALERIVDLDVPNHILVIQAGASLDALERCLEPTGLFCPGFSGGLGTVGGRIAINPATQMTLKYGGLPIGELEVVTIAGSRIIFSSERLACDDLPMAAVFRGSGGRLGLIGSASLRLRPCPAWRRDYLVPFASLQDAVEAAACLIQAPFVPTELYLFHCLAVPGLATDTGLRLGLAGDCQPAAGVDLLLAKAAGEPKELTREEVGQVDNFRSRIPALMAGRGLTAFRACCRPSDMENMLEAIGELLAPVPGWVGCGSLLLSQLDVYLKVHDSNAPQAKAIAEWFSRHFATVSPDAQKIACAIRQALDPHNLLGALA